MAQLRYVEALPGEGWKGISERFKKWLGNNASLDRFGYSECDSIESEERRFACFAFPDQYAPMLHLFESWAGEEGRIHGQVKGGNVVFRDEPQLILPGPAEDSEEVVPPWLR